MKPRYATAFLSLLLGRLGLAWISPADRGFKGHVLGPQRGIRRIDPSFQPIQNSIDQSRTRTTYSSSITLFSAAAVTATTDLPRLTTEHLQQLTEKQYVVIPNFLPTQLQDELRADVHALRTAAPQSHFKVARIGQDSTNQLNTDIRVAETCFLGPGKLSDQPNAARETLYRVLDQLRLDLQSSSNSGDHAAPLRLDGSLTELLYAYYPQGGFYRRHRDAVPGSASTLRRYSLLLYLNERDWDLSRDGGGLRLYLDGRLDDSDNATVRTYQDVTPAGGTLVLFPSDAIPHEVLDTNRERLAVVGWYNRPLRGLADVAELSGGSNISPVRLIMLAVAAAFLTVGVSGLLQ